LTLFVSTERSTGEGTAQQVQLMFDVYKFAENIVIYLGEEGEGFSRAMKLFHALYEMAQKLSARIDNPGKIRRELPSSHEEVWYRLHDFFNRS
jgi:hypothetical protein